MKVFIRALVLVLLALPLIGLQAQQPAASPAKSDAAAPKLADVYHVFIVKAAPGKAKELMTWLKEPDPDHPERKGILLRHQDGDSWDFAAIEHIGAKATVETGGTPMTPGQRLMTAWHNDTFVAGPPWAEFAQKMGIDADATKTAGSVYVVSDYLAVPGQRDALMKMLTDPTGNGTSSGNVLFAHLEGASWNFLTIARYDSWEKFAENEKDSVAQTNKDAGGWYELRKFSDTHHDTVTDRVQP